MQVCNRQRAILTAHVEILKVTYDLNRALLYCVAQGNKTVHSENFWCFSLRPVYPLVCPYFSSLNVKIKLPLSEP